MLGILTQQLYNKDLIRNLDEAGKYVNSAVFCDMSSYDNEWHNFSVLEMIEAFHFSGNLVTDSLTNLQQAVNLGYANEIYYYVYSFDWCNQEKITLTQIENLIFPKHINLIARSESDAKILENVFNKKPKYIMIDWDSEILKEIGNGRK